MKKLTLFSLFTFITLTLTSCEVIGGIFKAGLWVGIIGIVVVIALILWLISKFTGRNNV